MYGFGERYRKRTCLGTACLERVCRRGNDSATLRGRHKKERTPRGFPQGVRESSGDLLSRTRGPGTIGDLRLNFRVRDGNGCDPHSITAETMSVTWNLNSFAISSSAEARRVRAAHAGQLNQIVERKEKRLTGY